MTIDNEKQGWQRVAIVDQCEIHVDCVNRTAPVLSEPTPYKMIRTTNVRNGYIDTENVRYVTEETYKKWTRRLIPKRGDIILTREAPLGGVGKIRSDDFIFLGQRLYHFRPDPRKLDADFLLYSLMDEDLQGQIRGFGSGSTVEHMRLEDIPNLEINLPKLPVQTRIAGILSAYDELIENCEGRIRILETMARDLYREWFVEFRFPGHENVGRIASSLGEIPEGWEVKRLGDIAQVLRGRSYRTVDLSDENGLPFLNLKCIDRDGGFRRSGIKRYIGEYKEHHIAKQGDILVAVTDMTQERRLVARAALVSTLDNDFGVFSMDLVKVQPKDNLSKHYLYGFLRFSGFSDEVKQHANGANVLHLSPDRITTYQFTMPPVAIRESFSRFVGAILQQIDTLQNQVESLRSSRDLLLPRLLSGEISLQVAETTVDSLIPFPVKTQGKPKREAPDEFKEAVLISEVVRKFSSPQYPLGRMRYNKFSYLAHRKVEDDVQRHYLKQAAGPYSPWAKYEGPEGIALGNKYIVHTKVGKFDGFIPGPKIGDVDKYLLNYPACAAVEWVAENFRYKKKDDLELITTVDFAVMDLQQTNRPVTTKNVKKVIAANPKWAPKLDRSVFSDENISKALKSLEGWFPMLYAGHVA